MNALGTMLLTAALALSTAAAAPVSGAATDRLQALANMPDPRAAHSATPLLDGRVLLAGGCNADGCDEGISGDALLFDPETGTFSKTGDLRQPRVGHRAVRLKNGSVLLIGGWTDSGVTASIERYVPTTGRFEPHGQLLHARDAFSATALHDGNILIAGGYADGMRRLAEAELFDPRTRKSRAVPDMASPRQSHTATLLRDGRVLVAGGSDTRRTVLDTLELFDPATGRFGPAGALAKARHKHAAVLLDDEVLILGGAAIPESGYFADTEIWNSRTGRVTTGPRMHEGRYKFLDSVVAFADGGVLVAGSGRSAEYLAPSRTAFHTIDSPLGHKLSFTTATPLTGGRVLVAGGYDPEIRVNDAAWVYLR